MKTEERIPKGTMVWMRDSEGELVKAVARYSQGDDQGAWNTGVRVVPREMRSSSRDPVRGAAELRWPAPSGRTSAMVVTVVDLSDNGAGVIAPHELAVGHSVQLIGAQFECFCAVRNCTEEVEGGYRIGLMFARTPHDRQRGLTADWID
jgi:hypothetical protein